MTTMTNGGSVGWKRMPRLSSSQRIMFLTATVATAAVTLFVIVVRTLAAPPTALSLPWVVWATAFAASEALVVHWQWKREAHSFSMTDLVLGAGLFLESPSRLVCALVLGVGSVLVLHRRQTGVKLAFSVALLIGVWSIAGGGTYAALSGTTSNTTNTFSAGTVALTDNDGGSTAMFNLSNQRPGVTTNSCIKVTYTGSVTTSALKLYATTVTGTMAPYLNVTVTKGTDSSPSFSGCTNFTADATNYYSLGAGVLFNGTLSAYPTAYAAAVSDPNSAWTNGTSASYKFSVSVADTDAVQGLSSGATFTWEARS
jgi:hypothetical protein